jgi:hypothetical protein
LLLRQDTHWTSTADSRCVIQVPDFHIKESNMAEVIPAPPVPPQYTGDMKTDTQLFFDFTGKIYAWDTQNESMNLVRTSYSKEAAACKKINDSGPMGQ